MRAKINAVVANLMGISAGIAGHIGIVHAGLTDTHLVHCYLVAFWIFIALYLVWLNWPNKEKSPIKPKLHLELMAAFYDRLRIPGARESRINIYACICLTNLTECETLIKSSRLSLAIEGREYTTGGTDGDRTVGFIQHNTGFRLGGDVDRQVEVYTPVMPLIVCIHPGMPLKKGIHRTGLVTFTFPAIQDQPLPEQTLLEATRVRLVLTDSFGGEHDLKVATLDIPFGTMSRPD